MKSTAQFSDDQRRGHHDAADRVRRLANDGRNLRTQIERLTALAAQYDMDVKKLTFASQANVLFDPLAITVCLWCLQSVEATPAAGEDCVVCHRPITSVDGEDVDLGRELRAVKTRQKELTVLLDELHGQVPTIDDELASARAEEDLARAALDATVTTDFAPVVAQRVDLREQRARLRHELESLERFRAMHDAATRRRQELDDLLRRIDALRRQQQAAPKATSLGTTW